MSFFNKWNNLIKNMGITTCKITPNKEQWDEEFEGFISYIADDWGNRGIIGSKGKLRNDLSGDINGELSDLVTKYLGNKIEKLDDNGIKVKISAKKGKIVIEKLEE